MKDYTNLINKVIEYRNTYEADKMLEYFTDDVKFVVIDDNKTYIEGKTALKTTIEDTKVEDRYRWTVDNITSTDDKIITLEHLTKPNNTTEDYIFIYEVQDDHIKKVWMTTQ